MTPSRFKLAPATAAAMSLPMANPNANPSSCNSEGAQPGVLVMASVVQTHGGHAALVAPRIGAMNRVEIAGVGGHEADVPPEEVTEGRRMAVVDDGRTREGGHNRSSCCALPTAEHRDSLLAEPGVCSEM